MDNSVYTGIKVPVTKRIPVRIENLVVRISTKEKVKDKLEPWVKSCFEKLVVRCGKSIATPIEKEAFYVGTVKLIHQMALSYYNRNPNWYSLEELTQLCYMRLWKKLKQYNPDRSTASTWIHYVCLSVLNKEYNSSRTRKERYFTCDSSKDEESSTKGIEKYGSFSEDHLLRMRMRDAIFELFDKNTEKQDILIEIFGNPSSDNYEPPFNIPKIMDVCNRLNDKYKYNEIYTFHHNTVIPFFRNLFPDFAG